MERQRPKSPMGGQETKVAYNGQSKVKSSLRENNNDQSHLRWTVQSIDLPTYRVTNDPSDPPKIIDSNRNH